MKLSIIIATKNRPEELKACLESIGDVFNEYSNVVEVIVVNQGTHVRQSAHYLFSVRYINATCEAGASLARNIGAENAKGEFLWFLDDDAQVTSFDLDALNQNSVYFIKWNERRIKPIKFLTYFKVLNKLNVLRHSGTPMYLVKNKVFASLKGFNTKYGPGKKIGGSEDAEFILKLYRVSEIQFIYIGSFSHKLEQAGSQKLKKYANYRAQMLIDKREWFLIFANIVSYTITSIHRKNYGVVYFLRGLFGK